MAEVRWSTRGIEVRCREDGSSVSGEGFYLWDEKLSDALDRASILQIHRRPQAPPDPSCEASPCGAPPLVLPGS